MNFNDLTHRDKEARVFREADNGQTKYAVVIEGDSSDPRLPESDIALETISAIKCIYHNGAGVLKGFNNGSFNEAQIIGITRTAATAGNQIKYYTEGRMDDSSFNFTAGAQLYLGLDGEITETAPTTGFRTKIGSALEVGAIMINIDEPIEL